MIGNRGIDQEVQNKVDAYRGNPNALAQKYSQNQQLIDLLALQKLKSEKESAAREMQLQMGGQQMPTIAESRENEVLDLTKQELAQQTTGAMQQQQRQKQQAAKDLVERTAQMPMQSMSPMMQGVAGLPANNMSPKAMAAGGIVAFEDGGPTAVDNRSSFRQDAEAAAVRLRIEAQRQALIAPLSLRTGVPGYFTSSPQERREAQSTIEFLRNASPEQIRTFRETGTLPPAPTATTAQAQTQDMEGSSQAAPEPAPAAPAAPRALAPQGQPGIAGIDPRAISIRDEIAKYIGFSPDERARREKGMAELAALDARRFNPDRRRSDALTQFLLNAAGRTGIGSVLAGGGAGVVNYENAMDAEERQSMLGRQKQVDELIAADVGTRKSAFDAGIKTATDYAEIAAKQAANALSRESMDQNRAFTILGTLEGRFNESVKLADANYNNKIKNIGIFPGQQPTPAQQQQLSIAQAERQRDILGAQQRLGPLIQQASIKAGIPSAGAANGFRMAPEQPTP